MSECKPLAPGERRLAQAHDEMLVLVTENERLRTGIRGGAEGGGGGVRGGGTSGRGLRSFPFLLNLSSSVHHMTQLNS